MVTLKTNNFSRATEIQNSGSIEIISAKVYLEYVDLVAIEILLDNDECVIAAYGDKKIPSIILSENNKFSSLNFIEFKNFKVWSADLSGDILRICLTK